MTRLAAMFAASLLAASCASSPSAKKDSTVGTRILECVVVERGSDGSGSAGTASRGPGNFYLVFEGKDGEATARYRFEVSQQQWVRFHEGDRVRLTLNNNILVDIRPSE